MHCETLSHYDTLAHYAASLHYAISALNFTRIITNNCNMIHWHFADIVSHYDAPFH